MLKSAPSSMNWKSWSPKRGEVYLVNLGEDGFDSEQSGLRPSVVISNNIGNSRSSILTVAPISTRKKGLPMHVPVSKESGLKFESYILTEHIRSVSKRRFFSNDNTPLFVGELPEYKINMLEDAIRLELGMTS